MTRGLEHLPTRTLQPREEKALGEPYSDLPVSEGEGLFIRACSNRTRGNGLKLEECR